VFFADGSGCVGSIPKARREPKPLAGIPVDSALAIPNRAPLASFQYLSLLRGWQASANQGAPPQIVPWRTARLSHDCAQSQPANCAANSPHGDPGFPRRKSCRLHAKSMAGVVLQRNAQNLLRAEPPQTWDCERLSLFCAAAYRSKLSPALHLPGAFALQSDPQFEAGPAPETWRSGLAYKPAASLPARRDVPHEPSWAEWLFHGLLSDAPACVWL